MSKEVVVDGCDVGKWFLLIGIGYLIVFFFGGVVIGVFVMEGSFILVVEVIGIRIVIVFGCVIVLLLIEDVRKKFVYGEEVILK